LASIDDDVIHMGAVGKHRRHPGFGQHADPGAGKLRRMARTAGVVMTASPIQLVDRDQQALDMMGQVAWLD
jgi:hypothetical protein